MGESGIDLELLTVIGYIAFALFITWQVFTRSK